MCDVEFKSACRQLALVEERHKRFKDLIASGEKNFYELLELNIFCELKVAQTIGKANWKRLALGLHTDKLQHESEEVQNVAKVAFINLTNAKDTLTNSEHKQEYDEELEIWLRNDRGEAHWKWWYQSTLSFVCKLAKKIVIGAVCALIATLILQAAGLAIPALGSCGACGAVGGVVEHTSEHLIEALVKALAEDSVPEAIKGGAAEGAKLAIERD